MGTGSNFGAGADPPGPQQRPVLSVVVPIYDEEEVIPELYRRTVSVLGAIAQPWELVCVNDGSRDDSLAMLLALRQQDERIKIVDFSRNFGHQTAITAGMDFAQGDAVVIIDADLQDPPELIAEMFEKWSEGYEVVYAVRAERRGESRFKLWTANAFYRLLRRITDVEIPANTGDFRLLDRRVVLALRRLREKHRFMRGLSSWVGFRQVGIEYQRAGRFAGATKYPLSKMLRLTLDAITSFSYIPLRLSTYFGFVLALLSLLGIVVTTVLRLSGNNAFFGQASTLVAVLFLGGIQLIFLGIIGEYLARIYDDVKARPLYVVARAYGFADLAGPLDTPSSPANLREPHTLESEPNRPLGTVAADRTKVLRTGIDVVKIERIRRAISRYDKTARAHQRFLARLYTEAELNYCCGRAESLAARFAAKEAIAKALGTGAWRDGIRWIDLEIVSDARGAPSVRLHGEAARRADSLGLRHWSVSLSHDEERAMAFVVALGESGSAPPPA